MKIWLDDLRPAPEDSVWCRSVNEAKRLILHAIEPITLVDCDHDLGDYACDGSQYCRSRQNEQEEKSWTFIVLLIPAICGSICKS